VPDKVIGDPTRLRQVIVNLVGNAIKFTPHGEVVLRVEWMKDEGGRISEDRNTSNVILHPSSFILFSVSDTGIGIPPEKQDAIFEAFTQADTSTTRRFGGTGLGLTISTRLVDLMGGRVWVESEVGRGSTFHFTARLGLVPAAVAAPSSFDGAALIGVLVLVVDDNATSRRILCDLLTAWQMRPCAVGSGTEALEKLSAAAERASPFPLALVDHRMQPMDGPAIVQAARRNWIPQGTRFVLLTGLDWQTTLTGWQELGIAACLHKPVKPSELRSTLLDVLARPERTLTVDEVHPPAPVSVAPHRRRILLAEDNSVNQLLVVKMLEKLGHDVTVVANGREAVESLRDKAFDMVLMDVQMPELDGMQATALIRREEIGTGRHLPIIALTAHAMKGDREQCISAGMDGYLAKPVNLAKLNEAIQQLLPDDVIPPAEQPAANHTGLDRPALLDRFGDEELLKAQKGRPTRQI
jgi:two-component system, sensor histidine kinase and response regulator